MLHVRHRPEGREVAALHRTRPRPPTYAMGDHLPRDLAPWVGAEGARYPGRWSPRGLGPETARGRHSLKVC